MITTEIQNNSNLEDLCSKGPPLISDGYLEAMIKFVKHCTEQDQTAEMLRILTIELNEMNSHNLLKDYELAILVFIYTIMIIFGSCGALLVIYAVIRQPKMRTARNLFIVNLATSDLILCLFTQPFNLLRILYWHYDWTLGQGMCKAVAVGQATNIFVSTISIIAIALDRLRVIVYPTRSKVQQNGAMCIILSSWLFALLMACPMIVFVSVSTDTIRPNGHVCSASTLHNEWLRHCKFIYGIVTLVFQYCLPITIVSYAYTRICFRIRKRQLPENRNRITSTVQSELPSTNLGVNSTNDPTSEDHEQIGIDKLNNSPMKSKTVAPRTKIWNSPQLLKIFRLSSSRSNDDLPSMRMECSRFKLLQKRQTRTNTLLASITVTFILAWLPLHIFNLVMDQREFDAIPFSMDMGPVRNYKSNPVQDIQSHNNSSVRINRFPDHLYSTADNKIDSEANATGLGRKITIIHSFCLLCVLISACANPVLYGWLNENFHRQFTEMFPIFFRKKYPNPPAFVVTDVDCNLTGRLITMN